MAAPRIQKVARRQHLTLRRSPGGSTLQHNICRKQRTWKSGEMWATSAPKIAGIRWPRSTQNIAREFRDRRTGAHSCIKEKLTMQIQTFSLYVNDNMWRSTFLVWMTGIVCNVTIVNRNFDLTLCLTKSACSFHRGLNKLINIVFHIITFYGLFLFLFCVAFKLFVFCYIILQILNCHVDIFYLLLVYEQIECCLKQSFTMSNNRK